MKKLLNENLQKYNHHANKKQMTNEVSIQYGPQQYKILNEVKSRIEHPEDLIFTDGSIGAKQALMTLKSAGNKPELVSLKWDGSVSVIFGRDASGFAMADKSGFSKGSSALPRSSQQAYDMIYNRAPDQEGRSEYAGKFASLFPYLKKLIPTNFKGFLQADVLWFDRPPVIDGAYQFRPNKIVYRIPVPSDAGKLIQNSKYGIAIHSYFKNPLEQVPVAVPDASKLRLNPVPQVVVFDSKLPSQNKTNLVDDSVEVLYKYINGNVKLIDDFLNKDNLKQMAVTDLPLLMKSFLANKASSGQPITNKLAKECYDWLKNNPKLTDQKKQNIQKYIVSKKAGFTAILKVVNGTVAIKNLLKDHFDKQTAQTIQALLLDKPGHEGFVVDAPSGKVKIVDRPKFMQKGQGRGQEI
jgi:hypothetical protein